MAVHNRLEYKMKCLVLILFCFSGIILASCCPLFTTLFPNLSQQGVKTIGVLTLAVETPRGTGPQSYIFRPLFRSPHAQSRVIERLTMLGYDVVDLYEYVSPNAKMRGKAGDHEGFLNFNNPCCMTQTYCLEEEALKNLVQIARVNNLDAIFFGNLQKSYSYIGQSVQTNQSFWEPIHEFDFTIYDSITMRVLGCGEEKYLAPMVREYIRSGGRQESIYRITITGTEEQGDIQVIDRALRVIK